MSSVCRQAVCSHYRVYFSRECLVCLPVFLCQCLTCLLYWNAADLRWETSFFCLLRLSSVNWVVLSVQSSVPSTGCFASVHSVLQSAVSRETEGMRSYCLMRVNREALVFSFCLWMKYTDSAFFFFDVIRLANCIVLITRTVLLLQHRAKMQNEIWNLLASKSRNCKVSCAVLALR